MNEIEMLEKEQMRGDIPGFKSGDTVKVFVKIIEGQKERIQLFEGVVIRRKKGNSRANFHGQKNFLRNRRGEDIPPSLSHNRQNRSGFQRESQAREALLSKRAKRQKRQDKRRDKKIIDCLNVREFRRAGLFGFPSSVRLKRRPLPNG